MLKFAAGFLVVLLLHGSDTLILKSGTKLTGAIRVEGDRVFVKKGNDEKAYAPDSVDRIEWSSTSAEPARLRERFAKMQGTALERARWCRRYGLAEEAKKEWEAVLAADAANEEALVALGKAEAKAPAKPEKKGPAPKAPKKAAASAPVAWKEIKDGLSIKTENFELRGDVGAEKLAELAELAEKINGFHAMHFQMELPKGWKMTFFRTNADFVEYSKKIGSTQYGGGGYCENELKEFVGHNEAGHSLETLLRHELAHAYYYCPGPFWLREGAATLVESLSWEGGKPVIGINKTRLDQIRGYWKEKKHTNLRCCTLRPVFPLAYAHHWSFHYYVWVKKGEKFYRQMLQDLKTTKESDDLTDQVVKLLGMKSLEDLEKDWKSFIEGLK